MKKWGTVLLVVLLVASLGLAPAVSADTPGDIVEGTGRLEAHGDGFAAIRGTGWVRVNGNGILWVRGAERVEVEGFGYKKEFPNGWTEYVGYHGHAHIAGRGFTILLMAAEVDLYAVGSGWALLWGVGTYSVNALSTAAWSEPLKLQIHDY